MISLMPARIQQADQDYARYVARLPRATKFEDCLDENFWAHVAMTLTPWDRIEILSEDMSYHAELVVIATDRLWARVALLSHTKLEAAPLPVKDEMAIQWSGPHTKYRVLRGTVVLQDGFITKPDAEKWKTEHAQAA